MLVDDEEPILDQLESLIQGISERYQIVAKASSGMEALNLLDLTWPEVIMIDIRMPEMDGLTFLREAIHRGWEGKAVVISGYSDFPLVQEALRLGVLDYLLKPITQEDVENLLVRLEEVIRAENQKRSLLEENIRTQIMRELFLHTPTSGQPCPEYISSAIQYIQQTFTQRVTLRDIAQKVGVAPAYLSYSFKKWTGQSLVEYITKLRMEAAKCLLKESSLQVQEIAEKVGYDDVKYFARVFRKSTGYSPLEYRKRHQKILGE